jgi:hypothetical protein
MSTKADEKATMKALKHVASIPVTVHLFERSSGAKDATEDFDEISGAGYEPMRVTGKIKDGKVVYDTATFVFNDQLGKVCGWFCTDEDGEFIPESATEFDKPFVVATPGDQIDVNLSR